MTELQLITKAIDRLKMADDGMMKYNPDWSTDEKYKTILNLISTAYQCLMELEKIKVSSHETDLQGANLGQLQQHVVMQRSELLVCPNCKSNEIVEFLNRNKRQCQICEHLWQTNSA